MLSCSKLLTTRKLGFPGTNRLRNVRDLLLAGIVDRVLIRHQAFIRREQLRWRRSMHVVMEWMEVWRVGRSCGGRRMITVLADGRAGQARRPMEEIFGRRWVALGCVERAQVAGCRTRIVSLVRTEISCALLLRMEEEENIRRWKIWNIITCRRSQTQEKNTFRADKTEGPTKFHGKNETNYVSEKFSA